MNPALKNIILLINAWKMIIIIIFKKTKEYLIIKPINKKFMWTTLE